MECNKDEAARAKKLAEEKMKDGDFEGAHKLVIKAQRLFPSLDNIQKMIAVCDVHISANKKLCGLDDWYGILEVQQFADADTIKKQYRKLALLLHPDKNKFPGAEAAFKLVGEANRFLSDRSKRSQYDIRYRSHSVIARRQSASNSGRHCAAANKPVENTASVYMFWTCCKHCGHRYKYLKEYMDTVMHCSICKRSYIARNTMSDGVPPSSSAAVKTETVGENACTGAESGSSAAEMEKNGTGGGNPKKKNQENQKNGAGHMKPKKDEGCTESKAEGGNPQKGETCTNNPTEIPKADVLKPQPEVKESETGAAKSIPDLSAPTKNRAAKKRSKAVEKPTMSFEVDGSDVTGAKRKPSRKKLQVPYSERGGDSDFVSPPPKKTRSGRKYESNSKTKQTAEDSKLPELADFGVTLTSLHAYKGKAKKSENSRNKDILSAKNKEGEGCDGNEKGAAFSSKIDEVENGYKANGNRNMVDETVPEFNVFGDEREPEKISVNQMWSTYDPRDGMPRRYVWITKVLTAEFKLWITCLEPVLENNNGSIPVACGVFEFGERKEVEDLSIFSGQMLHFLRDRNVVIYPKKGEIWALFRDWNEEWNTSLEKHKLPYKYDFVEIVNDFDDTHGIGVAYLGKINGFVSLFHREAQNKVCQIQFPVAEMLRFSHKVPAVKMTGMEKDCVPANSYELDPKALPKYIFQVDPVDMGMNSETLKGKADGPCPEAPMAEVKAKIVPDITPSSRKRRKPDDDDDKFCSRSVSLGEATGVKGKTSIPSDLSSCQVNEKDKSKQSRKSCENSDAFKLRKSPRLQTTASRQRDEKEITKHGDKMETPKKTDKGLMTDSLGTRESPNGIQQQAATRVGGSSKERGHNGELPSLSRQNDLPTQLDDSTSKSTKTTPASSSRKRPLRTAFDFICKTPPRNAFDFKTQRSEDKFRVNQIWAIYGNVKNIPSEYVKIQKIETKPEFMLHAAQMKLQPPSTEPVTRPVSCGHFKLETGNRKILPLDCFSHQVKPVYNKITNIRVYPRKGEIWALYQNCDSTKQEHDVVEVVEDYCADREIAKVVVLTAKGFSNLYIIQRKQGSSAGLVDIPKAEMSRFSHRIPAIRQQKRATSLGEVVWELDPKAIPVPTIVLD